MFVCVCVCVSLCVCWCIKINERYTHIIYMCPVMQCWDSCQWKEQRGSLLKSLSSSGRKGRGKQTSCTA